MKARVVAVFVTCIGLVAGLMMVTTPAVSVSGAPVLPANAETVVLDDAADDTASDATPEQRAKKRPNVVVLQTDDQTVSDLAYMPNVKKLIARHGVTFDQMVTPFAICCPSRAAQMTGSYPHNNGVQANFPPQGGYVPWEKKSGNKHIGKWLQNAGYHTAHIGKYINGYAFGNRRNAKVPKGWSEWYGSTDPSTYQMWGYRLNEPTGSHKYGRFHIENPAQYSTTVYAQKARSLIKRQANASKPFYLQVAFLAPHVETVPLKNGKMPPQSLMDVDDPPASSGIQTIPPRPAPRDRDRYKDMPLEKDPSFNEADVSDKGPFVRDLPLLTDQQIADLTEDNRQRRRSLIAVDRAVSSIVKTLKQTGQYKNTVIVVMGDNGYMLGQHRISKGKYFPYEPSIRIPFLMSGPGIKANRRVGQLVSLIDLAPTLLDLVGAKPKGRVPDGVSLKPLLTGKRKSLANRSVLLSSGPQKGPNGTDLPLFDGVRSPNYSWWRYQDGFEEMYDLRQDPYQLSNVATDPAYAGIRSELIAQWEKLRDCYGKSCRKPTTVP